EASRMIAGSEVLPALGRTSEAILQSIEFDAEHARALALEIQSLRDGSVKYTLALDALCVLLTLGAGALVGRAMIRQSKLVATHRKLLEERAGDLEQFAGRVAHDIVSPLSTVALALSMSDRPMEAQRRSALLGRGQRSLMRVQRIVEGLLDFA